MSNSDKQINSKRRAAVLGGLGGAAAVTAWHKPLVNAVVLPAHAQASMAVTSFFASGVTPTIVQNKSVLDYLVEPAVAGDDMQELSTQTYIVVAEQTDTAGEEFDIGVFERLINPPNNRQFSEAQFRYQGLVNTTTGGKLSETESGCMVLTPRIDVEIVSVSETGMELNFTSRGQNLVLEPGSATLPTPVCVTRSLADSYFNPGGFDLASGRNDSLMDFLVPEAHAGTEVMPLSNFGLRAVKDDANNYTVETLTANGSVLHRGPLNIDGTPADLAFVSDACMIPALGDPTPQGPTLRASITAINPFEIQVRVTPEQQEPRDVFARAVPEGVLTALTPNCNLNGT